MSGTLPTIVAQPLVHTFHRSTLLNKKSDGSPSSAPTLPAVTTSEVPLYRGFVLCYETQPASNAYMTFCTELITACYDVREA